MPEGASGSAISRAAVTYLRRNITSGAWPINSRIPTEPELMQVLGVGKTTVREAVRSLANLGMLEALAGRGTFVRSRTPVSSVLTEFVADYESADILLYRRALEVEGAARAALHRTEDHLEALRAAVARDGARDVDYPPPPATGLMRTPGQFHSLIIEASGSRLLVDLYAGVMAALRQALDRGEICYGEPEAVRRHDHEQILEAIEAGDPHLAAEEMAAHADRDLIVQHRAAESDTAGDEHAEIAADLTSAGRSAP